MIYVKNFKEPISFSVIRQNVGFYLDKILSNEMSEGFIYNYMPYIIMHSEPSFYKKVTFGSHPKIKYAIEVRELLELARRTDTAIRDIKSFIRDKISNLPINSSNPEVKRVSSALLNIYIDILENVSVSQYSYKLLESSMISLAPIVPYTGIIKPGGVVERAKVELPHNENIAFIFHTLEDLITSNMRLSDDVLMDLFYINILTILKYSNSDNIIDDSNYNDEYDAVNNCHHSIPYNVLRVLYNSNDENNALVYYFLAYLNYNNYDKAKYLTLYDAMVKMVNSIGKFPHNKIEDIDNLVTQMEAFSLAPIEESVLALENVQKMEFEHDKKVDLLYNANNVDVKEAAPKYNIDVLLSYLYTNTNYIHNDYTNSLFRNEFKLVDGFSYIGTNKVLVCEIDDKYLASPVIDVADDHTLKIVRLDKMGNIEVAKTPK